ncbi:MAG: hypothetical protein IKO02_08250 [Lentisphaeria bacterium]|nr:hypothetical protein [Lentisphaeria bacterium]
MERGNDRSDKAVRLQSFVVIPDPDGKVFEEVARVRLILDVSTGKGEIIAQFFVSPGGQLP